MDERAEQTLFQTVNIQDRMLNGCEMIFSELRQSMDPEVADICTNAYAALKHTRDTLEAMIDGYNATKH